MAKFTESKVSIPFVKNLIWLLLVCSWIFTVANAWCPGGGCREDQVCCNGVCVYESSCLGWYCSSDFDCSFGESCCNNVCVNGSNCLGGSCNIESDCSIDEVCCSRTCKSGYSCSGLSCTVDSDCATYEYCCVGTCGFDVDCNDVAVWIVLGSVFGSLIVFVVIFIAVLCICRYQRRSRGRVIEGQRISTGTTVVQGSLPYASLPSYQQAYPYYPPPQYVQYPPYNVGSTKSSELPPPYSGASEETSGGVYTPQTNYGAVSNPSFPV